MSILNQINTATKDELIDICINKLKLNPYVRYDLEPQPISVIKTFIKKIQEILLKNQQEELSTDSQFLIDCNDHEDMKSLTCSFYSNNKSDIFPIKDLQFLEKTEMDEYIQYYNLKKCLLHIFFNQLPTLNLRYGEDFIINEVTDSEPSVCNFNIIFKSLELRKTFYYAFNDKTIKDNLYGELWCIINDGNNIIEDQPRYKNNRSIRGKVMNFGSYRRT